MLKQRSYDFVIAYPYNGKYKRVNVKQAGLKSNKQLNSWSISVPGGPNWRYKVDNYRVDLFLVWLPHQQRFIELEGNFFEGSKSKSKLIPKGLL